MIICLGRQSRTEGGKKLNVNCEGERHSSINLSQLLKLIRSKFLFSEVVLDQTYEWKQTRNLLLSIVPAPHGH